ERFWDGDPRRSLGRPRGGGAGRAARGRAGEARGREPEVLGGELCGAAEAADEEGDDMSEELPAEIRALLEEIDEFILTDVRPMEREDDNARFFDHRREYARTNFDE